MNNCRRAKEAGYRHGDRRGCLKGTRETVLDEIESWANDFDKSPVFWLNGLAGTGKSTIAQTIAERVFAQDCLGASFFCSRDFEDRSDLKFIFPTLAFQLAHKYPGFRSHFVSLLKSNPDVVHESLYGQMQQLIAEPLQETGISTVIVIDALDECKDDEPSSVILSVLGRFVKQIPGVKFFITGRPELRIETGFRLPLLVHSTDVFVLHNVLPSLINRDIRVFLKYELSELSWRRRLGGWPSDEHIDVLCRRAAELFVYAVATVKFLDSKTHLPRDRLDVILKLPDSTAPEGKTWFNPKTTLDSLYMSILRAAFDKEDPDVDSKVRTIIGTIALLVNPLPPLAIAELMGLESEEVILFLTLAQSLLAMGEDYNQPVKPFHKSFPDFITDSSRCDDPRFYVSPRPLHLELATNCLRVMNRGLKRNLLSLPEYALNSEVENLQARIDNRVSLALQYACRSWHNHLTETGEDVTDVVANLLVFIDANFLAWLEVLSVLGDVGGAVVALENLIRWLEKVCFGIHYRIVRHSCSMNQRIEGDMLLHTVKDCFRFLTKFFEPINVSATHIYHSALELCPTSSVVRVHYYDRHNRITYLPRVVVGTPESWDPVISASSKGYEYKSCTWSPCGRSVATQMGSVVEVRNQLTFELLTILQPPEITRRLTGPLAYSPDGRSLACSSDSSIIIWDIQTGGVAKELHCGTNNTSLVWSLDGRSICTICGEEGAFSVDSHNVAADTTLSPGKLRSDDYPHLWAHESSFRVITTSRSYLAGTIEVFEIGCALIKIDSFRLRWDTPTANPEITFSATASRVSVYANDVLHVFGNRGSDCLLRTEGPFFSQSFSSDGSLFGSFGGGGVNIWKENFGHYSLWKRLPCPSWPNPSLHFSPVLSSILGRSGSVLQAWRLDDVSVRSFPDHGHKMFGGVSRSGTHIATAQELGRTVTVVDSHSRTTSQLIDTGTGVEALVLTGNILLVVTWGKITAWLLTDEGLVDGVPSGRTADLGNGLWTIPMSDFAFDVVLRVGSHVGVVEVGKTSSSVYHTETGEFLPHEPIPQHLSGTWNLYKYSLRGRDQLRCHSLPRFDTPPEGDWQVSQATLQEGWVKDPEGRHRLWIPVEWRTSWDRADWLHDIRTQFSIIGDKPVIVKF